MPFFDSNMQGWANYREAGHRRKASPSGLMADAGCSWLVSGEQRIVNSRFELPVYDTN